MLGNYSEDVTLTGTVGQILLAFAGLDFPGDIRDITFDITNWEWTQKHGIQFTLDAISILPFLGVVKYGDEAKDLIKGGKVYTTVAGALAKLRFKGGYIEHLKTVISFDRNATKGIGGGHNFTEFKNYFRNVEGLADSEFIEKIVPHPSFNGIYEVTYKVPLKDGTGAIIPGQYKIFKNPKTVYDPNVISDADIVKWGEEAMKNGIVNGTIEGNKLTGTAANGLKFEGWIDSAITDATEVKNFYPIIN